MAIAFSWILRLGDLFQDAPLGCPLDRQDLACGGALLPELHRCDYVGDQDSSRRSLTKGVRVQRGFRREHGTAVGSAVWREQQSRSEVQLACARVAAARALGDEDAQGRKTPAVDEFVSGTGPSDKNIR